MYGPGVTHGFRVPPLSIADIRRRAEIARKAMLNGDPGFFRMGQFIESLFNFGITLDVVPEDHLPLGVEACCIPEKLFIQMSEPVYTAACRDDPRARFTTMHELGHILLAHTRAFNRITGRSADHKAYEDSEWQANQVAAEMLMPLADIRVKQFSTAWQLQCEYQVSPQAAELRIRQLKAKGEL